VISVELSVYSGEVAGAFCFSSPAMILLQRFTHTAQMKALFPTIWRGTPGAACGAPATICPTSLCDLPQNEQRNVRAFILAIIFSG
jgi:hypothetical protein